VRRGLDDLPVLRLHLVRVVVVDRDPRGFARSAIGSVTLSTPSR